MADHLQPSTAQDSVDTDEIKRRAVALLHDAERLMKTAQDEAASVIAEAQRKAVALVEDAGRLRDAAEQDATAIRAEAEADVRAARAEADGLLQNARATHEGAVARAREMIEEPVEDRPSATGATSVQEASEQADRILRIAKAEAEARSAEIVNTASERMAMAEADLRRRHDTARQEHRALIDRLRKEEIEIRARIRDLEATTSRLEAASSDEKPALVSTDGPPPVMDRSWVPGANREPPTMSVGRVGDAAPSRPKPEAHRSVLDGQDETDPDVAKAMRRIRRRA